MIAYASCCCHDRRPQNESTAVFTAKRTTKMDTRRQQTSKIGNKKHVSSSIQGGQAKTEFGPAESRVRVRDARHAAYLCFHWPVQSSTSSRPSILALTVHQFAAVGTVASASTSAKYPLRIILGRQQPTSTSSAFSSPLHHRHLSSPQPHNHFACYNTFASTTTTT